MKQKEATSNRKKIPWSTKAAMTQVYELNLWGDHTSDFYSGQGSHHPDLVNPYVEVVTSFLRSFERPLVVCDLGCGDFNVGHQLVPYTEKYIGVDIVSDLIDRNRAKFQDKKLEFHCLDVSVDHLPSADCAILRQVLQHVSNAEVQMIVNRLNMYKYVILTEHLPDGDFIPNKDIISGQGIRVKKQSGIDVMAPPFNLKVKEEKQLVSVNLNDNKGVIITTVYKMF